MSDKRQFTVILPADVYESLSALAKSCERTIAGEARVAIGSHLHRHGSPPTDATAPIVPVPGQMLIAGTTTTPITTTTSNAAS